MLKKFMWLFTAACLVACPKIASAGETDLLIQKLVDKGVLTQNEAQILSDETKQDVAKQNAKGTNDMLPSWIQTIKLKGDTRVRFEAIKDKTTSGGTAAKYLTHERLRVRLGLEAKPNDLMKVGIGIATGKPSDARSRNVSLGNDNTSGTASDYNTASPKNIVLDYAYAQYTPVSWATVTGGKFQNPLWSPWDMVWKGDITPEGAAVQLNYPVNSSLTLFFNNLDFVLRNNDAAGGKQPGMYAFQPGFSWDMTPKSNMKVAVTQYMNKNIRGMSMISYSKGGNRLSGLADGSAATAAVAGYYRQPVGAEVGPQWVPAVAAVPVGTYQNNYNCIQPSAEIKFIEPFGGFLPYAAVFGDYIKNLSAPSSWTSVSGFDAGIKFGYEKVADWKQWKASGAISKLGKDAWVSAFSDSDRYKKGQTDTVSYEGIFELGLGKNSSLVVDYYYSQLLLKQPIGGGLPEQLVQVDWNLKF